MALAKQKSTNDKKKTTSTTKTTSQTVSVGGRDVKVSQPKQTTSKAATPSTVSNVSVGGRSLSNTQKNDTTAAKKVSTAINNNAATINNATKKVEQANKSFAESQSKSVAQVGKENQDWQIQQHQERLDRVADRTREEAQTLQNQKDAAREQRVAEDPTYAYNFYEFSNGANTIGGSEYVGRVNTNNQQFKGLYDSFQLLEDQYRRDGDYGRYANGFEELSKKYDQLMAEADELNTYKADYNNSVQKQYQSNRDRMRELTRMMANIKKMGGSRAELDALNEEYVALKDETDKLQNLYDDIESLKENDYYEWLKENGEEKDIRDYESYLASEDDNGLAGFVKNRVKALSANVLAAPYAVTSLADISRDLLGEVAGDLMDSVAVSFQEKGYIDDESFKKVMEVSDQLKAFEYDNDNNLSQMLRDYRQRVNLEINAGNKSDFELIAGEMIDNALENYIRYQALGYAGTFVMALTTFADSFKEYKDKGYSNTVSALSSGFKGYVTWWSENLSTERYFKVLGSSAGSSIDKMFFSMLAENMVSMVPEEGIEEGVEYAADYAVDALANFLQPGIDTPEFKMGDLLKGSLIAMGSTAISATGGAFTGAMMYENDVPVIANGKDFAQFTAETEYLKFVQKEEADIDAKRALGGYIAKCERRIAEYKEMSPTAGAVTLSTDNVTMPTQQEADSTMKQAMVPEAVADSNEQEKTDIEVMEASEYVRAITQSYLAQNGIGISVEEYVNADEKTRQGYKKGTDILKKSKVKYGIARMFNGQNGVQIGDRVILNSDQSRTISFNALADLDDKTYNEAMKFDKNGVAKDTNTIFSKAGGDPAVETSAIHELLHYAEKSGLYKKIKEMVLNMAGEDRFNTAAKRIGDIYKGRKIDADAEREAMAFFIQENIRSKEFAKQLASVNGSAFSRLYKNLTSALSGDDKVRLENIMANAIRNAKGEMERETRRLLRERKSGYVGENYISPDMAQMSVAEYDASGRDILKAYLKNSDLSEESQNELLDRMEEAYNVMTTFMETGEFPEFSKWQGTTYSIDREGNFSVVVTNGDYEMNIDFSTVCKKRKMMDKVLNELSRQGYLNTALTQNQITQLRQIIQEHGLEVACGLCFVDAKRFNQGNWAGRFETKWNKLIDQVAGLVGLDEDAEISTFGITTGYEASPTLADINFSDPVFQSFVELSKGKTEEALMARAIINNPDLRGYVSTESLYGSEGFEQLKANKPKLYDLVNNSGGSSKPKLAHTEILYMNEIVNNDVFKAEDAKEVGGVRVQSFSDFMTNMVFDYVQMFGDMEAKGLTGHSYTKVKEYAILFGKSGMKINMSIIPAGFDSRKYTAADIRELRKNNRKEWNKLRENAGLDEDGNYMFDQESFDWDLALEIQNLEGYDKNVGTICVGVSDKHIFKMLDDDNVCMIIPYHRSGINPEVALAMGINVFNDYTKKQNTCFKNAKGNRGRKVGIDFNWYTGFTMDDGTHFKGMIENDYDARATADEYLRWCEANDYVPKFDAFMDHPNYYKLLIDYRAYDKAGNVAPQNPIKISGDGMNMMPTYIDTAANPKLAEIYGNDIGFVNVLQKSLNTYELNEETQNEELSPITKDVVDKLGLKKSTNVPKMQHSLGEQDSKYMDAVNKGDMEEAQRMVDEVAKKNGYDTAYVYWRGDSAPYNVLKTGAELDDEYAEFSDDHGNLGNGLYFTPDRNYAEKFAQNGTIRKYYLKSDMADLDNADTKSILMAIKNDIEDEIGYFSRDDLYDRLMDETGTDGIKATGVGGLSYGAREALVRESWQAKLADPVTYDDNGNVIPLSQRFNPENNDIRYALGEEKKKLHDENVEKHGAFKKGEKAARDIEIAKGTSEGKTARGTRTVAEAQTVTDDFAEKIQEESDLGTFTYQQDDLASMRARNEKEIRKKGYEDSVKKYLKDVTLKKAKNVVVTGELLLQEALKRGNTEEAMKIAQKLVVDESLAGQATVAARIFKTLSPEYQLITIESQIKSIQEAIDKEWGKKAPKIKVDPALIEEVKKAETEEEREKIWEKIGKEIANQVPSSLADKVNAWRYLMMLGNPKTHIRNVVGNTTFSAVVDVKQVIASAIEKEAMKKGKFLGKEMKQRNAGTINMFNESDKALYEKAKKDFEEHKTQEHKYNLQELINKEKDPFSNNNPFGRSLNWLVKKNGELLSLEDSKAMQTRYAKALAGYLKHNNLTFDTATETQLYDARKYANKEALRATFNDTNRVARWLGNGREIGTIPRLVIDALIPFKNTPLNIINRGVEYSPLGLVKGLIQLRNNEVTANEVIDSFASGLTGSGIFLLGVILRSMGWLRIRDDDEKRKQYFDNENGEQDYAIQIGDIGTYTIDWLDPIIMPLAMGASAFDAFNEHDMDIGSLYTISTEIVDPIFETSMLSGVTDALSSYGKTPGEKIGAMVQNMTQNYLLQFIPTLFGQVARTVDPVRRNTYPNNGFLDQLKRKAFNKVPGASMLNEPYINRQGQEELSEGGNIAGRALLNMVSPGYYSSKDIDKYDEELYRLYDSTGDISAFPSNTPSGNKFTYDKKDYELSPKQFTEWNKIRWQTETKYVNEFIDSSDYKGMSDEDRIATIKDIRSFAGDISKKDYLKKIGIDYKNKRLDKINGAIDAGMDAHQYFDYENSGGEKQAEKMEYLESSGLTDKEKKYLWDLEEYKTSYEDVYNKVFNKNNKGNTDTNKKKTTSKKSSSSSKKSSKASSSGGGSGIRNAGKLNKLAPVTSKSLINDRKIANASSKYFSAYASVFNRSGKKPSTGGRSASVTCPRCGSSVSASSERCPVCGANL